MRAKTMAFLHAQEAGQLQEGKATAATAVELMGGTKVLMSMLEDSTMLGEIQRLEPMAGNVP